MENLENENFAKSQISHFIEVYRQHVLLSAHELELYEQYLYNRYDKVLDFLDEKEKLGLLKIILQIETNKLDEAEDLIKTLFVGNTNWVIGNPDEEFIKVACANKYYAKTSQEKHSLLFRDGGLRYLNKMLHKIIDIKRERLSCK